MESISGSGNGISERVKREREGEKGGAETGGGTKGRRVAEGRRRGRGIVNSTTSTGGIIVGDKGI